MILLEQSAFSMDRLLEMDVDSHVRMTYHVDPETGQFTYHDYEVDQGARQFSAQIRIEEDEAHCRASFGPQERVVALPPGTLLENSLFFPHLISALMDSTTSPRTYDVFDVADQEVQRVTYSRAGEESLELAGLRYDALMVDKQNLVTGVLVRLWLDSSTGICVKIMENDGRVIYLADGSLAQSLERFEADPYILTKTNMVIADLSGVSYMKVRAKIRPTGMIVTPESLNVPGQSFVGNVEENLIEGVFEIEHRRYDGSDAPPFPPNFSKDRQLASYLQPSKFIESDDPGIVEKALELTEGSADSWEAARRLGQWVSTEIAYSIPGGGSARGVFESRAGECGGHSVLLAAFCRAVGIPSRMVWGVMYVPREGGTFGQHGWNEIYMGAAGWITVDATAAEIDFVDSGHIRLGEFESFTTWANAKEFEILEYRNASATPDAVEAAQARYARYEGPYTLTGTEEASRVYVQDGSLVFEIPGKVALAFEEPDDRGHWRCKLAPQVYLVFATDEAGVVSGAHLHERHRLPRISRSGESVEDVPEDFASYVGQYHFAALDATFTVRYQRGSLSMHHPLEDRTSTLSPPDEEGGWSSSDGRHTIYFESAEDGSVDGLTIDAVTTFERVSILEMSSR